MKINRRRKAEARIQREQGRARRTLGGTCVRTLRLSAFCFLSSSIPAIAAPSQQDVFKSIQRSVEEKGSFDSSPVLWLVLGGGALLLVLVLLSRRGNANVAPRALNHPGKLIKKVLRELPISSGELKQLKLLAQSTESETGEPISPLTLLLCPSLMGQGLKSAPPKLDRAKLAQVLRKLRKS